VKFSWIQECPNIEKVDLLTKSRQIYQGEVPDVSKYFIDTESKADVLVVPHDAKFWPKEYLKFILDISKKHFILYFNRGDFPRKNVIKNSLSVQLQKMSNDNRLVYLITPNVITLEDLPFRPLNAYPTISFIGYVPKVTVSRLIRAAMINPRHPVMENGALIRRIGVKNLNSINMPTIFKSRTHYGGAASLISSPQEFRLEYISSFTKSDLVFSPRGDANTSQRFFEALSAGRVPIIPCSNIQFPKLFTNKSFFSLEVGTLSRNAELVINEFWRSLTKSSYEEVQLTNRLVYKKSFSYSVSVHKLFGAASISALQKRAR
jgi:hypothetical protein